ncbi:hypothetical protein [Chryseobacterium sp. MFBS3-17]|uniref:hypothetical protein n=1 Tax=Chryseobacterium sp. MFBS3-17 TaxID=2886689 RepID=UPI001D0EF57C|nr:hypothetical protein [Chryseobacterium sp. MFBS3-17]MCC2589613.1 hypothetical protein [Chryseobacterium sp. MFBS3-17]
MNIRKFTFTSLLLLYFSILTFNSCVRTEDTVHCFPDAQINVILNLNLPAYQNLQNVGGWIYVNEQSAGTRGLIAVKTSTGFKIYDRNAPHLCPDAQTTLKVQDNIKIVCDKDGSEWILYTGEPTQVAQLPPKTYMSSFNSATNILSIYN